MARGAPSDDGERLVVDLPREGAYALRVFAFDGRRAPYTLRMTTDFLTRCVVANDCALGEMCDGLLCRRLPCQRNRDCPAGHICPLIDTQTSARTCLATCADDGGCNAGSTCKSFFEGDACYPAGEGTTAAPCSSATDCAGNRTCIDWPGGYCATAGCDREVACDDASLCAVVDGRPVCVIDCWVDDAICERPESYQCGELFAPDSELVYGCFPQAR